MDDASFDVALSRLGLIYVPDRLRGLAEMRRVLKPGGRAVVAGFTTPARNGFFSLPIGIIRRHAQLPTHPPDRPGPFSLGDPAVMEAAVRRAGFRTTETRVVRHRCALPSAVPCTQFERESFGALHQMMGGLPEEERAAVWEEVADALRQFEDPTGFEAPAELCIGVGVA